MESMSLSERLATSQLLPLKDQTELPINHPKTHPLLPRLVCGVLTMATRPLPTMPRQTLQLEVTDLAEAGMMESRLRLILPLDLLEAEG